MQCSFYTLCILVLVVSVPGVPTVLTFLLSQVWFAGLRGAIAFALSTQFPGPHRQSAMAIAMWVVPLAWLHGDEVKQVKRTISSNTVAENHSHLWQQYPSFLYHFGLSCGWRGSPCANDFSVREQGLVKLSTKRWGFDFCVAPGWSHWAFARMASHSAMWARAAETVVSHLGAGGAGRAVCLGWC